MAAADRLLADALKLAATLDEPLLDERLLEALARLTGARALALWAADGEGLLALRATRGDLDRSALPPRQDPRAPALAAHLRAGLPFAAPAGDGVAVHLPLLADGEPEGLVRLVAPAASRLPEQVTAELARLAPFAGAALRNARRARSLERAALRDRESGALNPGPFAEAAARELDRARRHGRPFSLVVLAAEAPGPLRRESGGPPRRTPLRPLVAAVGRAAREADLVGRVGEGELHVLLPETDHFGARRFALRALEEAARDAAAPGPAPAAAAVGRAPARAVSGAGSFGGIPAPRTVPAVATSGEGSAAAPVSAGVATFPADGDALEPLVERARLRLAEERTSPARRLAAAVPGDAAFWELCDALLDGAATPATDLPGAAPVPGPQRSALLPGAPGLLAAVQAEAARELGREPRARAHLYLGARTPASAAPALAALPRAAASARAGDAGPRLHLLGPRGSAPPPSHPLVTLVPGDGDPRLAAHDLVLFLSGAAAYALVQAGAAAFHTADAPLVELLVARLAALYHLEPV